MKDSNSAGARRVMRSSGRLTRIVALVKVKDKTWNSFSYIGWSLMRNGGRTGRRTVMPTIVKNHGIHSSELLFHNHDFRLIT